MKESLIYPYCIECNKATQMGQVEDCESCGRAKYLLYKNEIIKGCPVCFSPLIDNEPAFCSDHKCSGYGIDTVPGLVTTIKYRSDKIFSIKYLNRTVFFTDLYWYSRKKFDYPEYDRKIEFMRDFFFKMANRFLTSDTYFEVWRFNFIGINKQE